MSYEITGIVHAIHETQKFASGFCKREFVVETSDEKYPQQIKLEVVKDKCDLLDLYRDGDPITASFNLRGNEYNGKHYVTLQAWKLDRQGEGKRGQSKPKMGSDTAQPYLAADWNNDVDDEIPF
jgi:hypothetical protein